jgi:hemerythrin
MAALIWSDALALQQPRMDDTHREFVDLLCQVETAAVGPLAALVDTYAEFVAHTERHFAQEDRWMLSLGFDAQNCHAFQHTHVLQVLHEVQHRLVEDADVATVRLLVPELAQWFPAHAQNMDAALADTMVACGFDPDTGDMTFPPAAAAAPITGCGGSSCN